MTGLSHCAMVDPHIIDSLRGMGGGGNDGGHHDGVVSGGIDHNTRDLGAVVHADDVIAARLRLRAATKTPHGGLGKQ